MSSSNTPIGKQPLKVFRTFAIEAKSNRRAYYTVEKIRAHRGVHTKCNIESTVTELLSHIAISLTAFGFIEDDKLNIRYICQELCFSLADDPSNLRVRPVVLDAANDSQGVTGVTNRRKANDTYFLQLRC